MSDDLISRSALLKLIDERMDGSHIQSVTSRRNGKTLWSGIYGGVNWCRNAVIEAPAVDAVPVVRCKDCQWSKPYKRADEQTGYYCQHPAQTFTYGMNWERIFEPVKAGTDYCSYGERKDNATD